MTNRSIYMVFAEPVPGREDEFNDWYERQHIPDVLRVKGILAAIRYEVSPVKTRSGASPPTRYLTIFELDGDPAETMVRLAEAGAAGAFRISSSIATEQTTSFIFTPTNAAQHGSVEVGALPSE
jgi:hypothetical protein